MLWFSQSGEAATKAGSSNKSRKQQQKPETKNIKNGKIMIITGLQIVLWLIL